jgi:hypothetical protein
VRPGAAARRVASMLCQGMPGGSRMVTTRRGRSAPFRQAPGS